MDNDLSKSDLGESSVPKSYIFLKIHIRSSKSNTYSVTQAQIDHQNKMVIDVGTVASVSSKFALNLKPYDDWIEHRNFIARERFSGSTNLSLSNDINNQINGILMGRESHTKVVDEIISLHQGKEGNEDEITEIFAPSIKRIIFDKDAIISPSIEFVLEEEFKDIDSKEKIAAEKEISEKFVPADTFFEIEDDCSLVECAPVLSPVKGTPVFDLIAGNKIMVKVISSGDNYLFDYSNALAFPAVVLKINKKEGNYRLLVHLKNKIYGRIVEKEVVNIKEYKEIEK